ncbi:hypothetical protein [Nocardioides sp. InS609-2]|nr:hypothetical protein [Nocardioides sp. InS609-2]
MSTTGAAGSRPAIATERLHLAFSPPLMRHRLAATCDPRNSPSARVL